MTNDTKSIVHTKTKWNCKYHIVFAPKCRRKVFYGEKREAIGKILRQLCEWKGIEIIEAEICPDYVHKLASIPPKTAVSSFMGYPKGKNGPMIYEEYGNLKYKYRGREFWRRGYCADTVEKNKQKIAEYIKRPLDEDKQGEQMTMFGKDDDPFQGGGEDGSPSLTGGKRQACANARPSMRLRGRSQYSRALSAYEKPPALPGDRSW